MRNKVPTLLVVFLLPLVLGWGVARAADTQSAGGMKIVLADGSLVNGAASVVISLDTPYGQIKIPSSSLVSAKFDAQQKMADIQLNDAQMKLKYNPASSDLKVTTAAGQLTIALANVITVSNGAAKVASGPPPQAPASQYPAQAPASVPPSMAEAQQSPTVTAPPTVVYPYQYPYQNQEPYQYAPVAPSYPSYYYPPDYYYAPGYWPYVGWPYWGFSIGIGPRFHGGFRGGFHGGFHGGFGGFHGGFGHR